MNTRKVKRPFNLKVKGEKKKFRGPESTVYRDREPDDFNEKLTKFQEKRLAGGGYLETDATENPPDNKMVSPASVERKAG